jgi:hypothetical protein
MLIGLMAAGWCLAALHAGGAREPGPAGSAKPAPAWVDQLPADSGGKSYFVAVGLDADGGEAAAQDAAALDLVNQINRYLGVTISAESTGTELATANSYQASVVGIVRQSGGGEVAGLRIADRYVVRAKQGLTVYLLGEYQTADLEREKAKRRALEAESEASVAVPEGRGREAEARGAVFEAAQAYLQAARAALDPKIRNGSVKLERNIQNAIRSLDRVSLAKVSGQRMVIVKTAFTEDFVVELRDADSSQPLAGVTLMASFKEYQANGKYSWVRRTLITGTDGRARIRLPDAAAVGSDQLTISLNLADGLQALAGAEGASRDLVNGLMNQVAGRKAVFDYVIQSAGRGIPMVLRVLESDESGNPTGGGSVVLGMQQRLTAAGFRLVTEGGERLASGQATVLSLDDRGGEGVYAKASATLSVTDARTGDILLTISQVVNGRGENAAKARADALSRLGQELGDRLARDLP